MKKTDVIKRYTNQAYGANWADKSDLPAKEDADIGGRVLWLYADGAKRCEEFTKSDLDWVWGWAHTSRWWMERTSENAAKFGLEVIEKE